MQRETYAADLRYLCTPRLPAGAAAAAPASLPPGASPAAAAGAPGVAATSPLDATAAARIAAGRSTIIE